MSRRLLRPPNFTSVLSNARGRFRWKPRGPRMVVKNAGARASDPVAADARCQQKAQVQTDNSGIPYRLRLFSVNTVETNSRTASMSISPDAARLPTNTANPMNQPSTAKASTMKAAPIPCQTHTNPNMRPPATPHAARKLTMLSSSTWRVAARPDDVRTGPPPTRRLP